MLVVAFAVATVLLVALLVAFLVTLLVALVVLLVVLVCTESDVEGSVSLADGSVSVARVGVLSISSLPLSAPASLLAEEV